ncbi:uncharacterized protein LOC131639577 [Vicia villosa]|uniref:uncharacterized protein LOC131639577 n=1 Tax=Vicia villosa TaxID=3911 RepID=UPI00273CE5B6|nr:uncharacterized protein LOC131639577 [Vicia villosa]
MNFYPYNIRGGGIPSKKKRISYLIQSNKVEVCFIQEIKISSFNDSLACDFWGSRDVEWTASNSVGAAGGMVIFWRRGSLSLNYSIIGKGYVCINTNWEGLAYNLVNVYAPCSMKERRLLWNSLVEKKRLRGKEEWCVGGDFNEVVSREERKGEVGSRFTKGMEEFRKFIEQMDLVDIPCVGGKFTWFKDNDKAMSIIDRFLLSRKLIDDWKVEEEVDKLNDLDKLIEENIEGNVEHLVQARREASREIWNDLSVKESMLRLKSRNLWLKEGDRNSNFFHNAIKGRQRRNAITSLEGKEGRVEGVENIKEEAKNYFLNFFKEADHDRPLPEGLAFSCLNENDVAWLERPFTEEEVKEAAWSHGFLTPDEGQTKLMEVKSLKLVQWSLGTQRF